MGTWWLCRDRVGLRASTRGAKRQLELDATVLIAIL